MTRLMDTALMKIFQKFRKHDLLGNISMSVRVLVETDSISCRILGFNCCKDVGLFD